MSYPVCARPEFRRSRQPKNRAEADCLLLWSRRSSARRLRTDKSTLSAASMSNLTGPSTKATASGASSRLQWLVTSNVEWPLRRRPTGWCGSNCDRRQPMVSSCAAAIRAEVLTCSPSDSPLSRQTSRVESHQPFPHSHAVSSGSAFLTRERTEPWPPFARAIIKAVEPCSSRAPTHEMNAALDTTFTR
jgi:hypothetical protein